MSAPNLGSTRPSHALPGFNQSGFSAFLRKQHPTKTADHVHARSGVPADTVKNWLKGRNQVSLQHSILLFTAYGPNVLKSMWSGVVPGWLDSAVQAYALETLERKQAALNAERASIMDSPEVRR